MNVRVLERGDEPTGSALAARVFLLTDEALSQPQCQALLADSTGTLEQDGLWQARSSYGASQPPFDPVMAQKGGYGHGQI